MINEKIVKYYLLCSVRMGARKHLVNELPDKKIEAVMTKKEIDMYLRVQDGNYVAREIIIGGARDTPTGANNTIIVFE